MSQLDLAVEAEVSQRHLSFVESGRARPSREMVLKLSERLGVPPRQQNHLLLAAGFAPSASERSVDDPNLAAAMIAVRQVLAGHEPNPAFAVDRHWNLVEANRSLSPFLAWVEDTSLLAPPINVLRLSLHPNGLAPFIANLREWRTHLIARLRRQNDNGADPVLAALIEELSAYPSGPPTSERTPADQAAIAHPLKLRPPHSSQMLTFISTITVFGTALDITLSELGIESFFPADDETRAALSSLSKS